MGLGAVREPRRDLRTTDLVERRRRHFADVRHPLVPGLRLERVIVCPSGIRVLTTLPPSAVAVGDDGPPAVDSALLNAAEDAARVLRALLPQRYRDRVHPVLCLVNEAPVAEVVDGVLVTSPGTLEHILGSSPVVLSTSEVHEIGGRLDAGLEPFPLPAAATPRRSRRWWWALAGAAASSVGGLVAAAHLAPLPLPW